MNIQQKQTKNPHKVTIDAPELTTPVCDLSTRQSRQLTNMLTYLP